MDSRTPAGPTRRCGFVRWALPLELLLMAACAAGAPAADSTAEPATLESLIGDAACDADAQCHTIGIGSKACGGPERFLAWSSLRSDGAALHSAAARAAGVDRTDSQAPRRMSNCALVVDPGAYCANAGGARASDGSAQGRPAAPGQCRLRASSSVSAAEIDPRRRP
jgi:hypothetical protein